jgi:O-antigen ligase
MAKRPSVSVASTAVESRGLRVWTIAFGMFLGLALLKFPNPGVMDRLVTSPTNGWEWALMNWPLCYAWPLLIALIVSGLMLVRRPTQFPWAAWLPLVWIAWAGLSAVAATGKLWNGLTLGQHAAGVACFYLGWLVAGRVQNAGFFLMGVMAAMVCVLIAGWEQHFGGLAASRTYFYLYTYPKLTTVEPEMLKRIDSSRIFATLFYPNSLAGALLLWMPALLGWVAEVRHTFTAGAKWLIGGLLGVGAVACLVWSGSKTGWLLALGMFGLVLLRLPLRRRLKVGLLVAALLFGGAGFTARYLGFFQKGATSVVARMDYYRAGAQMVAERPLLGSGPGTFGVNYKRLKPPEAEMAQLAHNDYLQQATDSGLPAALAFGAAIGWVLLAGRRTWTKVSWVEWGVWLGLTGFALQSFVEFGFMVPATAWGWFGAAGWLLGRLGIGFDKSVAPS